ncbi:transporter substrate-binding domain-containing protein [Sinorhizobium meliloti]|nr:transporter substrate-binding domain-containing protein [Sinorhizobium meliloti]MDX0327989.1 transporter substrate-binding domain-containing protein [Sinorhizobium meliloti]
MKMQKLIKTAGMLCALASMPQAAFAKDTLKVGMDPLYAPFSFQTPDGKLTGFDFEISNALCDAIDVTCDIKAIPYEGSMSALQSGQIDTLINTYGMTKERLEQYTMVGPYIKPTARFLVTADSAIDGTEATLKGKVIGIEKSSSTNGNHWVHETYGKYMTVREYDQINYAVLDLKAGRVDAVFADENQLYVAYVKDNLQDFKLAGEGKFIPEYFGLGQGFVLRKGDEKWSKQLKAALDLIVKNGKYDAISKKYFGRNLLDD